MSANLDRFRAHVSRVPLLIRLMLVIAGVFVAVVVVVSESSSRSSRRVVWSDDFMGEAGSQPGHDWSYMNGGAGWGNGQLECDTSSRANSRLDGKGHLLIVARSDPGHVCNGIGGSTTNSYTSARLTTQHRITAKFGTLAVRAKLPTGSGVWPAFWALGANHDTVGWPACGEIDVVESVGNSTTVHGTLHGPSSADPKVGYNVTGSYNPPVGFQNHYHDFTAAWSPSRVVFAVDGHVYRVITKDEILGSGGWVFDHPFYLLLDVAVGGNFPGSPDETARWPKTMKVAWVRVDAR